MRTYPYTAYMPTDRGDVVKVRVIGPSYEHSPQSPWVKYESGDYGGYGQLNADRDLHETVEEAKAAGLADCTREQSRIDKLQRALNARRANLGGE